MARKYAPRTRQQGLAAALQQTRNTPGMCAATVRGWFGLGLLGDYDGDGAADAEDMWRAARSKHPAGTPDGDNPPDGVPVYYLGGSSDHGHIGVAYRGQLRGTDGAGRGLMGTTALNMPETRWGHTYAGWSDDLYGYFIRDEAEEKRRAEKARLKKWRKKLWGKRRKINTKLATIKTRLAKLKK
jgi:hypothetical protein